MIKKTFALLGILLSSLSFTAQNDLYQTDSEVAELFRNLSIVKKVNQDIKKHLPLIYSYPLIVGYFNMPSARMGKAGMTALGFSYLPPYNIYGLNFQMFDNIEFVGNYRVFKGVTESGFGDQGYGDDTDRCASVKFALYQQHNGLKYIPSIALGFDDFYGSRRFNSFYVCATEELANLGLELTFGWSKGRIKGFYGGLAWSPFFESELKALRKLSFIAEYDAIDYKNNKHEHPKGRDVRFPVNVGFSWNLFDFLQIKASTIRGKKIAASAVINYNLGTTKGFFPKVDNPAFYTSPVNEQPIGHLRTEKELAQELAYAFCEQGLNLYAAYLNTANGRNTLWLKVINTRYREELQVRDRIQHLLATLIPANVVSTTVVIEADGIPTQAYFFRTPDLERFRDGKIGDYELQALSPIIEATSQPGNAELLYRRKKDIWTFTFRPRLITFFGSTTGKIKYTLGFVGGPEGYLFDDIYYKLQMSFNMKTSLTDVGDRDVYNTSRLINVRSDSVRYFRSARLTVEQAYMQKGYNVGRGWFTRAAVGYFEPAYMGLALEALYYPVGSNWAFGIEGAGVLKRKYQGLGVTTKIRKFDSKDVPEYVHYIGYQYFFDVYYEYRPWNLDFKISMGQFLARDKGARFEVGRYFPSGMKFSIWYTITDGGDRVNYKRYYDKGVAFNIPLDFFLRKSSRSMLGYAVSAWLRDVGAKAATGNMLYPTIQTERQNLGYKLE
ncbi:MAG: hypothetical protein S4CHLAM37_00050 [Chlamydiia bacterium]|nr:hypothetical protein [Chlamydiia bacterium]